jgi:hypothetical protein
VIYQPPDIRPAAAVIVVRDDATASSASLASTCLAPGALVLLMAVKSAAGVSADQA